MFRMANDINHLLCVCLSTIHLFFILNWTFFFCHWVFHIFHVPACIPRTGWGRGLQFPRSSSWVNCQSHPLDQGSPTPGLVHGLLARGEPQESKGSFICIYNCPPSLRLPLEITNDGGLKTMLRRLQISMLSGESLRLSHKHWKLPSFPTSFLCKAGFPAVTATKVLWSGLDTRNSLQGSLSPITPRWDQLVAGKQVQGSHRFCIMVHRAIISLHITM